MCLLVREALTVGKIAYHPDFVCTELGVQALSPPSPGATVLAVTSARFGSGSSRAPGRTPANASSACA